jgi:hypothetical protein
MEFVFDRVETATTVGIPHLEVDRSLLLGINANIVVLLPVSFSAQDGFCLLVFAFNVLIHTFNINWAQR